MNDVLKTTASISDASVTCLDRLQGPLFIMCSVIDPNYANNSGYELFECFQSAYDKYLRLLGFEDPLGDMWILRLYQAVSDLEYTGCILNLDMVEIGSVAEIDDAIEADPELKLNGAEMLIDLANDAGVPLTTGIEDLIFTVFGDVEYFHYMGLQRFRHPLFWDKAPEEFIFEGDNCICRKFGDTIWVLQDFPVAGDASFYGDRLCNEDEPECLYCLRPTFLRNVARYEIVKQIKRKEGQVNEQNKNLL